MYNTKVASKSNVMSDALTPPGSVGKVPNRQAETLLHRKDDLKVAY